MNANGSSFSPSETPARWPTPNAMVSNEGESPETFLARQVRQKAKKINGNGMGLTLSIAAQLWPTPTGRDYKGANSEESQERRNAGREAKGQQLPNFAEHLWMTPTVKGDYNHPGASKSAGMGLITQAQLWATPLASDAAKGGPKQQFGTGAMPLTGQAHRWQTPTVADTTGGRLSRSGSRRNEFLLRGQAKAHSSRHSPETTTDGAVSRRSDRTLNPLFVEWLMDWPAGWTTMAHGKPLPCATAWTGCAYSETALYRWRRRMRSELSHFALHPTHAAQLDLFG